MYDIVYNENINSILFSNNSIQLEIFNICCFLCLLSLKERVLLIYQINLKKNKKISILNSIFNPSIDAKNDIILEKTLDFIFICIIIIFCKNIENAI
jgi:hypothetical protein